MSGRPYDAIVIGAGPGGNAAAQRIAARGGRACQIEGAAAGGTCVNVGCMPTKAMLAASSHYHTAGRDLFAGIHVQPPRLDGRAFMDRIHDVAHTLSDSVQRKLESIDGIDLLHGCAHIKDSHTVEVRTDRGPVTKKARAIVIATGSRPNRLKLLPWDSGRIWTSDDALRDSDTLPDSIVIVGAGPLGCEFATAYGELGVRTVILEIQPRLLPTFDPDVDAMARRCLDERGVEIACGIRIASVTIDGDDIVTRLEDGRSWRSRHMLAATGRSANTHDVGLEAIGLQPSGGILAVDDRCHTGVDEVYAAGDVAEHRRHAHLAVRMGMIAADNIMGEPAFDDRSVVPESVYMHPDIATIGLCGQCDTHSMPGARVLKETYEHSGSAYVYHREEGFVKVLAEQETGRILGAVWAGHHATDMIALLAVAMRAGLTLRDLSQTIHPHPSLVEMVQTVAESWEEDRIRRGLTDRRRPARAADEIERN